ncbi:MAG: GNAT family N-acetyltransferase [Candidatus Zixiibacteriota bacterium]
MIRPATTADLDAIMEIEECAFAGDKFPRRRWRYLLTTAHAVVLVEASRGNVRAAAVVVFRRGSRVARLYSIAVHPGHRGRGIARRLLHQCEQVARAQGCRSLRLEVRVENVSARRLYATSRYALVGRTADYYEDGGEALRFERPL